MRDYRPYAVGDDLRHVDWNYYASTRELLTRLFEEEEDLHVYLLLDVSPSMALGDGRKLRYAQRVAGALAYIALANLDRVSVVPFAESLRGVLPPSRGRSQIWKVFRFVDQAFTSSATDLRAALKQFVTQTKRRGLVVLISDLYDPGGFDEALDLLRYHRFEPLVFHVVDEDDLAPSLKGDVELVDCETGAAVRVTVTPALLARYAEAHAAWMESIAGYCRQRGVLYYRAPIQVAFDDLVLQVLRRGGFLA